jgi:D-amino-acid dehydrogenase
MKHVVVIGAGIIGTTTALALVTAGFRVTVVDARREAGLETSFANGGLLAANSALPWSSPGTPTQLLQWLGREDAPLLLRTRAIPGLGLWGLQFLSNCRPRKYLATAATLTAFGQQSLIAMERLMADKPLGANIAHGGLIELIRGKDAARRAELFARMLERMGAKVARLDAAQTVALEPTLAPIARSIDTGLLLELDAWGDARAFSMAVAEAAAQAGVTFRWETPVSGIDHASGKATGVQLGQEHLAADAVVLCAGSMSRGFLAPLRIRLPIAPVKGYSLTLAKADIGFLPSRPIVDDQEHVGVTPLGDRLRVAGTVEFDGYDRTLRPGRVANLAKAVSRIFPEMTLPAELRPWCGLRPMVADGMPIIDRTDVGGLYVNTGHGALGWTLACGSADRITSIIKGESGANDSPFRLSRSFW